MSTENLRGLFEPSVALCQNYGIMICGSTWSKFWVRDHHVVSELWNWKRSQLLNSLNLMRVQTDSLEYLIKVAGTSAAFWNIWWICKNGPLQISISLMKIFFVWYVTRKSVFLNWRCFSDVRPAESLMTRTPLFVGVQKVQLYIIKPRRGGILAAGTLV